jgi:adenine-specific DNA-methyltransferase
METIGVKYIGSKAALIGQILAQIDMKLGSPASLRIIDVFTGTTRVAQAFRARGWHVQSSDLAWASEAYAEAFLKRTATSGARIPALVARLQEESLAEPTAQAVGGGDWLTRTYCDVSGAEGSLVRMWQPANGRRADYIRNRIAAWAAAGEINRHEEMILVACLIFALDRVDNSVGIQQAYLKNWAKRTENALELRDLAYPGAGPVGRHIVGDCLKVAYEPADVAYIDPPYSSHAYSTYYHIWDSITRWDKPAVGLKTNRRIDRVSGSAAFDGDMVSPWNRRGAALDAFLRLADRLPVRHLLISYNNESLVTLDYLTKAFKEKYGDAAVSVKRIPYKRNIMATIGNAELYTDEHRTENVETLIWVSKN